jgi:hypothetical protein
MRLCDLWDFALCVYRLKDDLRLYRRIRLIAFLRYPIAPSVVTEQDALQLNRWS